MYSCVLTSLNSVVDGLGAGACFRVRNHDRVLLSLDFVHSVVNGLGTGACFRVRNHDRVLLSLSFVHGVVDRVRFFLRPSFLNVDRVGTSPGFLTWNLLADRVGPLALFLVVNSLCHGAHLSNLLRTA